MSTANNINYNAAEYWSRIFTKSVDAKSVCYPDWPLSYNQFLHQQQVKKLLQILHRNRIELSGRSVLEIGPGSGFWTHFFQTNNVRKYTGIDISKTVTQILERDFPGYHFLNIDVGSTDLGKSIKTPVDVIFAAMVLLHITDDVKINNAFSFFSQSLNENGYFIMLDSIAEKKVFGYMKQQAEGPGFTDTFHNKIRSMKTIVSLAKNNGLEIAEVIPAFNVSQMCFDFSTYMGYLLWGKLFYAMHRRLLHNAGEKFGRKYASFQKIFDGLLTDTFGMSMSSKWIVFRKKNS